MTDSTREPEGFTLSEPVVLERLKVAAQMVTDEVIIRSARLVEMKDMITGRLTHRLVAEVLAEKVESETQHGVAYFYEPASWWQHFKRDVLAGRRLTGWFVRRCPVTLTRHEREWTCTFTQMAKFPASPIKTRPSFAARSWSATTTCRAIRNARLRTARKVGRGEGRGHLRAP